MAPKVSKATKGRPMIKPQIPCVDTRVKWAHNSGKNDSSIVEADTPKVSKKRKRKTVAVGTGPRRGKGKAPRVLLDDSSPTREPKPPLVGKQTSRATRTEESSSKAFSENFPNTNDKIGNGMDHDPDPDLGEKSLVGPENFIEIFSIARGTTVDLSVGPIGLSQAQNPKPSKCMDIFSPTAMVSLFPNGHQTLSFPDCLQNFERLTLTEQARTSACLYVMRCTQLAHEKDDLADRVISLTTEKDYIASQRDKLQGELDQVKGELQVVSWDQDTAREESFVVHKRVLIMEEKLKEYTENLPHVRKEVETRAGDLFKQSPAFDAFTHANFMEGASGCRDLLKRQGYK
ncbi:hypothetical protein LWI28_002413 [Acer negundo]|uniref:Uncharacterized protein n=1 Tax=Acer negundo TaxID=4023 RepID=A0AAD5JGK6_ACENE|nr:hypothetical protein LWI28_002413 [Acer negundo]